MTTYSWEAEPCVASYIFIQGAIMTRLVKPIELYMESRAGSGWGYDYESSNTDSWDFTLYLGWFQVIISSTR